MQIQFTSPRLAVRGDGIGVRYGTKRSDSTWRRHDYRVQRFLTFLVIRWLDSPISGPFAGPLKGAAAVLGRFARCRGVACIPHLMLEPCRARRLARTTARLTP